MITRPLALVACLLIPLWLPVGTADARAAPSGSSQPVPVAETVTRHTLVLPDRTLAYTATVGTLTVPEEGDEPAGHIVYVSYAREDGDARARPVSFVINGGPGAASAFLHLGALGPERLAFEPDGELPQGPAGLADNPLTWLAFTDLVFIDPVGTGVSRTARGSREGEQGGGGAERELWSVRGDLDALGGAIRQWLARHGRWSSPKVLIGESYGGFRMAALAERLPQELEIAVDGVILISPALELALQQATAWDLLPWVLRVPSMAAIARAHGKAPGPTGPDPRRAVADAETFALGPLLSGLARGAALPPPESADLARRLATTIGLDISTVERDRGRIGMRTFAERLLEREGRVISLYDGTLTIPRSPGERDEDSYLTRLGAALAGAMAEHLRNGLGVDTTLPYLVLNRQVFRAWSWDGEGSRSRGRPGSTAEIARALTSTPRLRLLVAHGEYDLVTPYLASVYLLDQLVTAPEARARMRIAVYPGGHMFYTRSDSLALFRADAAALFADVMGETPGG